MRLSFVFASFLLIYNISSAQTAWYVPDDFSTIQGAISDTSVVNGDSVIVRPGTYVENIDFLGKAITLQSEQGPDVTIIDGNQVGSVVTCQSSEDEYSVLDGFTITNGYANYGGGMCTAFSSSPTVSNCTFSGNSAISDGGGMGNGNSSNPTVSNCTFSGNSAVDDGGGMYNMDCDPTVTNCTFTGNSAGDAGGGMFNHDVDLTVTNCTFSGNSATNDGGGMANFNSSSPTVTNCTFTGNSAIYTGGGMSNISTSNPTVATCTFTGNSADFGGGMFNGLSSSPTVTNCTFSENSAIYDGGGMSNGNSSNLTVANCTFTGNSAGGDGGGIFNHDVDLTVTNCTFNENSAVYDGGGMSNALSSNPTVTNCTFSENTAIDYGGGMINYYSNPTVATCTFTGNSAEAGGGMFNDDGSNATVTNTILWNNGAPVGPEIYIGWIGSGKFSTLTISYSDVEGGQSSVHVEPSCTLNWGPGMIDMDPLFVDQGNNDFHLTYLSPCKDTGVNTAPSLPDYDFEGDPRIAYGTVDMGADEFYPHLYLTGDVTPTGNVDIKFIGLPGDLINGLLIGVNIFNPPLPCDYGLWYMDNPFQIMTGFGSIPADGIKIFPGTIPASTPSPMTVYLQAAIDSWLTNICTVNVQ